MTSPLVTVVLPTFNWAGTIRAAVDSVLRQTWMDLELLVVDDCSTDDTLAMLAKIHHPRLRVERHMANSGASAARNTGIRMAIGCYVAFQDSDDEWLLDKLERQIAVLSTNGAEVGATFGLAIVHGRDAEKYGPQRVTIAPRPDLTVVSGDSTSQTLWANRIGPPTLLLRANVAAAVGPFDARLPCNNDWEYMIRLSTLTQVIYTPEPMVVVHTQKDSIHRNLRSKAISFLLILRKHVQLFKRDPGAFAQQLYATGRYLHRLGRYRSAAKCYRRAIQAAPQRPKPWIALIQAQLLQRLPRRS